MDKLLKKRTALVKRIDSLKSVVDKHATTPFTSDIQVKEHLKRLDYLFEAHEDLNNQIVNQCKTVAEIEANNTPFEVEDAKLTAISIELKTILKSISAGTPGSSGTTGTAAMPGGNAEIKLPKLELPTFSGEIHEWISFQDLFTASVHNNNKLSAAQKLQYLKAALKGESAFLIQSLPVTDGNYTEAWSMLKNRYQNKREILKANLDRLFAQQNIVQENPSALRKLVDTTNECVRAFTVMAIPPEEIADVILVHLISKKLDPESRLQWERSLKNDELPKIKTFCNFLDQHSRVTAAAKVGNTKAKSAPQPTNKLSTAVHHGTIDSSSPRKCDVCNENHLIYKCEKFLELPISERIKLVKQKRLCFNCLRGGHSSKSCKSGDCRKCSKKHHTLLHLEEVKQKQNTPEVAEDVQSNVTMLVSDVPVTTQVLLSTAIVKILDSRGNEHLCRALLDSASHASIVREHCVQRLGLQRNRVHVPVSGLGGISVGSCRTSTKLQLRSSSDKDFLLDMDALVFSKVTQQLPHQQCNPKQWPHLSNLPLADPSFHVPGEIDILLGGDVYGKLFLGGVVQGPSGTPTAMNTVFGWVLTGKAPCSPSLPTVSINHMDCDLDSTLQRFWEIEELPKKTILTGEEAACEKHFADTHSRDSNGVYVVRLPFRNQRKQLGESRHLAVQRLKQMERRFSNRQEFQKQYQDVLQEYLDLNHMEEITTKDISTKEHFYMPHHGVINEASSTTKLRVVFDGSAKSSTGVSLNETLMVGPKLQQDLVSILIRFRKHKIALTADIAKMYRQVRVHSEDTDYQRIVWRQSSDCPIKEYRLLTATFGTSAAPYLAVKCLQQLSKDEKDFPEASKVLVNDMYVDDLMSGAESEEKALQLQQQLLQLTRRGNFELRKWSSNCSAALECLPPQCRETKLPLRLDIDEKIKTLGIAWNPASDMFSFSVVLPPIRENVTKRTLLSDLAKVFDPLGWLSPTTIKGKILFQSLWKSNLTWDQSLSEDLCEEWKTYVHELQEIQKINLERYILTDGSSQHQLMGFSDASEKAYSAAVYIRSCNEYGEIKVKLVAAKTKVAPLKQISLPRLELCGAVLLIRLAELVQESLAMEMEPPRFYTDSTIVLAWIRSPPQRWKTFIANRVAEIQNSSKYEQWNHVSREDNPADCASRGISPSALVDHPLWWHGPPWLHEEKIPISNFFEETGAEKVEERKSIVVSHIALDKTLLHLLTDCSCLPTLLRITAYCKRFIKNCLCKSRVNRQLGHLTTEEYNQALVFWIKQTQAMEFKEEIQCLKKMKPLLSKSKLLCLNPFLDENGALRVGGRINLAPVSADKKHPLLLPKRSALTKLIIRHEHLKNFHAGPQLLLSTLQRKYWIISGRDVVRNIVQKCVECHRQNPRTLQPLMGNLPAARITPSRPFLHCGVDYAGPLSLKVSSVRGRGTQRTTKAYICLFICYSTKAVHLELVSDLTSECFLAALKRFVSRRGKPSHIYSDCGTTFVGANRNLKELLQLVNSKEHQEKLTNNLFTEGINWQYNCPAAPHLGSLWEAGVKSVKYHLRRVIGNVTLTFEEMTTILTQIESCLNSRPLTAISSDPNDLSVLTPGHFLIGGPLNAIPEPEITMLPTNRLSRWQLTQQLVQHFWNRWNSEYLSRLQQRPKWTKPVPNVKLGELVLLKNEKLQPTKWKLGRVQKLHPGKDGIVRVVTLKTQEGDIKRPVVKLSLLPMGD